MKRRGRAAGPAFGFAAGLVLAAGAAGCTREGAAVGAGAAAGIAIAQERSVEQALSDAAIKVAIKYDQFQEQIDELFRAVGVDVVEGRVLLTGRVKSQALRDAAVGLAWRVEGVRGVIDEIEVDGSGVPLDYLRDKWITAQLRSKILGDREVYNINYVITTANGVVYLMGVARDRAEVGRVVQHARDIANVRKVVNHVALRDDPSRPR